MRNYIWNTANPLKRLVAFCIDVMPVWILGIVISTWVFRINPSVNPLEGKEAVRAGQQAAAIISWSTLGIWIVYSTLAEASPWAGTWGKKIMGIRVRDLMGKRPTLLRAFVRNVTKILSIAPCCLGLLWASLSKNRRTWHELISGTAVVDR